MPPRPATISVLVLPGEQNTAKQKRARTHPLIQQLLNDPSLSTNVAERTHSIEETLHAFSPDVVLLDAASRSGEFLSLIQQIRTATGEKSAPIILITPSTADSSLLTDALRSGVDDYVSRSAPYEWLRKKIAFLATSAANAENSSMQASGAEDYYRDLVEHSADLICTHDLEGRILSVNRAVVKLTGYDPEQFVNKKNIRDILAPEVKGQFEAYIAAIKAHGRATGVMRVVTSSGERRIWEFNNSVRTEGVPFPTVRGIAHDVTERTRAEIALRESEERYRRIVETAEEGVWIIDEQDKTTFSNLKLSSMLGYPAEEIAGKTVFDLLDEIDRPFAREQIERFHQGMAAQFDARFRRKDGRHLFAIVSARPIFDKQGNYGGALAMLTDITGRKKLEQQLFQSQKMEAVGRLAGGIAHDFNNLLTAVLGYSELTLAQVTADNPFRGNLEQIRTAARKAADLTAQLLAFSRRQVLQPRVMNLNDVVSSINKILGRLIGEDVELVCRLEHGLKNVKVDPGQMEQVILNLALNARDAMPAGGRMTIQTANVHIDASQAASRSVDPGDYVMLAVTDSGSGMDEMTRSQIFEPFFTTKEFGKGSGLGLSTVDGIVSQSGGHIEVRSEPGQGSTFQIYLPATTEKSDESESAAEQLETMKGTGTILLVEDDEGVKSLAAQVLREHGYHVLVAGEATEAIGESEKFPGEIDLLLTDVVMPRMSGPRLAQLLLSRYRRMKVLYMSGYTENAIVRNGVLESTVDYLQKPFTPDSLLEKVRETLKAT